MPLCLLVWKLQAFTLLSSSFFSPNCFSILSAISTIYFLPYLLIQDIMAMSLDIDIFDSLGNMQLFVTILDSIEMNRTSHNFWKKLLKALRSFTVNYFHVFSARNDTKSLKCSHILQLLFIPGVSYIYIFRNFTKFLFKFLLTLCSVFGGKKEEKNTGQLTLRVPSLTLQSLLHFI